MPIETIALIANLVVMLGGAIAIVQGTRAQQKIIENRLSFVDSRLDALTMQLGGVNSTLMLVARQDERLTNQASRMDRLEAKIDERTTER